MNLWIPLILGVGNLLSRSSFKLSLTDINGVFLFNWQDISPLESLSLLIVGTVMLVPVILTYSAYVFWVSRSSSYPN